MRPLTSLLVTLGLCVHALASPPPALAVKGLFWKATKGAKTLYLVGSVHVGDPKLYPLPADIEHSFSRSAALVVESYSPKDSPEAVDAFMDEHGVYPAGDSIFKHLKPGPEDRLRAFAGKNNIDATNLSTLKPWVVMMVTGFWPMINGGKSPDVPGIDDYFIGKAKGGKPIVGVETTEFQLNLLASIPEDLQIAMLSDALMGPSGQQESLQDAWIAGDAMKIERNSTDSFRKYPLVRQRLLDDRNVRMVSVALSTLQTKDPVFMVVGAAHMFGPDGIVSLLRHKGFQVSAIHPK